MEWFLRSLFGLAGVVLLMMLAGCDRSTPIEEISVKSSGLEVRDMKTALSESDWPGWRGPNNDGVAREQEIMTSWDDEANIVWFADVPGRGHSSPVVVSDQVFIATANQESQQQWLLAYDRRTGDALWEALVHEGGFPNADQIHVKGSYANGTVACDGQHVFVAFLNRDQIVLSAYDFEGNRMWQREVGSFVSVYGYAPSPILYRSCVIVAADHIEGGWLAALDRETGKIVWRIQRARLSSYSTPCVAQVDGRPQLLISGCERVASYDPDTGEQLWSCPGTTESTCGTMVTDGTNVFASGGYPDHETLCVRGDGTGKVLWRNKTSVYEPSLLLANGLLFTVTDAGIAYCWAADSGELKWRKRLRGSFSASPVLCNDLILISSLRGETYVFHASGDAYRQVSKNKLGDDCYTSFAVSDGQLFTRVGLGKGAQRRERLYCIGPATDQL